MAVRSLRLTQDSPAIEGPLLYYGGFLKAGAGGAATADLYDGQAVGWDALDSFGAAASGHENHFPPNPILVLRGIFVDLGANVDTFVLYYDADDPQAISSPRSGP